MLHSIVSEYDIFFSPNNRAFTEKRSGYGIMTMLERNGRSEPYSFFSTDPNDYLKAENQITPYYQ